MTQMTDSGLKFKDTTVGDGTVASKGQTVSVHYNRLAGERAPKFDSSKDRNDPFESRFGAGQVIRGWNAGVAGMKVGGVRRSTISTAARLWRSRCRRGDPAEGNTRF